MATAELPTEQPILLHDVSWQTYENLLKDFDGRPIRITFDRGELEIMTLSHGPENYATLIGRFIETLTEELDIPIHSGGSTTLKRAVKKRGLEPDECYWIQHEPLMRGKKDFDITTDPPPDLAVEVDIMHSSLDRLAIYAALGILEIWRFDGKSLQVYRLGARGKYEPVERSAAFPCLPPEEVLRFLQDSDTQDETTLVRSFRRWVREEILPLRQGTGSRKPSSRKKSK
jgi:Uma2 family endonuclease